MGADQQEERRSHRRLEISLPLECARADAQSPHHYRTVTKNVSSTGLYFEADSDEFVQGMLLDLELTVPPGDGHFPYPMRVRSVGEVVRVEELPADTFSGVGMVRRGIATRLREPLKFLFGTVG